MDIAAAFCVLELSEDATVEDVDLSFRRLLKIYHPDRNSERTAWSHEKTVELNAAHVIALEYLRNGKNAAMFDEGSAAEGANGFGAPPKGYAADDPLYAARSDNPEVDPQYSVALQLQLASEYDRLLDQLFAFYSFGLENVHRRTEGSFRYRYRTIFKNLKNVLVRFQELRTCTGSRIQRHQIHVVHAFAAAFYENLLIKPGDHQVPSGNEYKAYRLYRQGSETLDGAIRSRLFGDQFGGDAQYPTALSTCQRALALVVTRYPRTQYTAETLIKLYLLETFTDLCDVLDAA